MTREEILEKINEAVRPLAEEEIADLLHLEQVEELVEMKKLILQMEKNGDIVLTRKGKLGLPSQMGLYVGRINRHIKGFGFLRQDNDEAEDIFIGASDLNGAMNGDRALVRLRKMAMDDVHTGKHYRAEGEVVRVLERSRQKIVGTLERHKNYGYVLADDKLFGSDIFIAQQDLNKAKNGMKVLVEITRWPEQKRNAEGKIVEILGSEQDSGMDVLSIMYKYDLPREFPPAVLEEAEKIGENREPIDYKKRKDLRRELIVTMDGADAKDLDDAVAVELLPNGWWRLGVHIADVTYYVKEDSSLDLEARQRGTSVYLVDRVIPMLPQILSNDLCSLNPQKERLTLSCIMDIDQNGTVQSSEVCESVIKTKYRLTYDEVNQMLAGDEETKAKYSDLLPMLEQMAALQQVLLQKRIDRGALNFDFPESKVKLDEDGRPIDIISVSRGQAERIIEEFMICANEAIAERYYWLEVPFLYRTHEAPKGENIIEVKQFLQIFGHKLKAAGGKVRAKDYQKILNKIHGLPEERAVSSVMLRSMNHARYQAACEEHFGLASEYYTHFTSPIRRYPDLAIHRMIKELLHKEGQLSEKRRDDLEKRMEAYALSSSIREKTAEEAERDSVEMKKVEYMKPFVGEVFEGIISGVTGFGFFVELENSVEGLVHISTLTDDFYHFMQETYTLWGENSRRSFRLGEEVRVKLVRVDLELRQIDFELDSEVL